MSTYGNLAQQLSIAVVAFTLAFGVPTVSAEEASSTPEWDSPSFNADGSRLLLTGSVRGMINLWIANGDGSNPKPFTNLGGSIQKEGDWSPNGSAVVFSSDYQSSSGFNIWTADAMGGALRQLTRDNGNNTQPRFSPDGNWIAFLSSRTGKRELWYMRTDGSDQKSVGLQSLYVSSPSWSPDSNSLVYSGCVRPPPGGGLDESVCNLFVTRLDASVTSKITTGNFMDLDPDWGPAGILFSSSRAGGQDVFLTTPAGAPPSRITPEGPGISLQPRWSRGSTTMFVFARTDRRPNIWTSSTGGTERALTRFAGTTVLGDLDVNGAVDCADLSIVKSSFGKRSGEPGYDVRADLDSNGFVDVRDLAALSRLLPTGTKCQ